MLAIFIHMYVVFIFVTSMMMFPSHSYCCYSNVFCFLDLKKLMKETVVVDLFS